MVGMDERDLRLRTLTYSLFVDLGRAPTSSEVADAARLTPEEVLAGWRQLHDQHALVLEPGDGGDPDGESVLGCPYLLPSPG